MVVRSGNKHLMSVAQWSALKHGDESLQNTSRQETDRQNNFCCGRSIKIRFVVARFGDQITDGAFGLFVAARDLPKIWTMPRYM